MSESTHERVIPDDLKPIVDFHGSLCPGTLMLTRLAQAAMRELGLPRHHPDLYAVVESNRCHTSGVQMVTGCVFGRRRMIVKDYGKAAVTLANKSSGRAVRATAKPGFPPAALYHGKTNEEKFWTVLAIPPEDYITLTEVTLHEELPVTGPPTIFEYCDRCGERVLDGRTSGDGDKRLCHGCTDAFYTAGKRLVWPQEAE